MIDIAQLPQRRRSTDTASWRKPALQRPVDQAFDAQHNQRPPSSRKHPHPAIQLHSSSIDHERSQPFTGTSHAFGSLAAQRTATGSCQNTASGKPAAPKPTDTVVAASTRRPPLARLKAARIGAATDDARLTIDQIPW